MRILLAATLLSISFGLLSQPVNLHLPKCSPAALPSIDLGYQSFGGSNSQTALSIKDLSVTVLAINIFFKDARRMGANLHLVYLKIGDI